MTIDVTSLGAVLLDDKIVCDGFIFDHPIRIQTHIHLDHMDNFTSSKGVQHILMTKPTLDLLIAEYNADIPFRENIEAIPTNQVVQREGSDILLVDSGHMLGATQVAITTQKGVRCGYSGDFSWPLEEVIEVDELVVDSTYGSPVSVRRFSQEEVLTRLIDLVLDKIKYGPIFIKTHRGTLQYAASCLNETLKHPIIATPRLVKEIDVYQKYGYGLDVLRSDTYEAKKARESNRYIRLFGNGEKLPADPSHGTCIVLSGYRNNTEDPVLQYSEKSFVVALSAHADYNGTIEYVRETKARRVVTDNTRGGHAVELAIALRRELAIDAIPSEIHPTREWGK